MSNTRVWDPRDKIRFDGIPFREEHPTVLPYFLHIDSFIGGGRKPSVYPQERTNFAVRAAFLFRLKTIFTDKNNLPRIHILLHRKSQVGERAGFTGNGDFSSFLTNRKRCHPISIPCAINPFLCQKQ